MDKASYIYIYNLQNKKMKDINIHIFNNDLRLENNHALAASTKSNIPSLGIYVFDEMKSLNERQKSFIYDRLNIINNELNSFGSSIACFKGDSIVVLNNLLNKYKIKNIFFNKSYDPFSIKIENNIHTFCDKNGIIYKSFKGNYIFTENEILSKTGNPYKKFSHYKKEWLNKFRIELLESYSNSNENFNKEIFKFPTRSSLNISENSIDVKEYRIDNLSDYSKLRDYPFADRTSYLSPHLRFGTIHISDVLSKTISNESFVSELIWRDFFSQIAYHFPQSIDNNFKKKYDNIIWRNNEKEFEKWRLGETGYPLVDAGIRELNLSGYMHNRVRMVVASFLCKHLLIDWRWGEAYFASKLIDYDIASNVGNWQWVAGSGCDTMPYFRIFNPISQVEKFDSEMNYCRKWLKDYEQIEPIIEHKFARERALETYKTSLQP